MKDLDFEQFKKTLMEIKKTMSDELDWIHVTLLDGKPAKINLSEIQFVVPSPKHSGSVLIMMEVSTKSQKHTLLTRKKELMDDSKSVNDQIEFKKNKWANIVTEQLAKMVEEKSNVQ